LRMGYSVFKLLTGLAIAALTVWKLSVNKAVNSIPAPLKINIHQLIGVRSAKSCIHLFITYQAIGVATTNDNKISITSSVDNKVTIWATVAPRTLRTPISFVRRLVVNIANPSNPRQLIKTDKPVAHESRLDICCSLSYIFAIDSSKK